MNEPGLSDFRLEQGAVDGPSPTVDSEITWLLHRAAQRLNSATGEQAEKYGLQLRNYIVLSALHKSNGLTQAELGKAVGLDKTTLMSQLDRLEQRGLVVRNSHPHDRRIRIPVLTEDGEALRAQVADACARAEAAALNQFTDVEVVTLRRMLFTIIGDHADPGSCI
jgi:MarR family transcriptional regulator, organic hydroperoxide resistance regulator